MEKAIAKASVLIEALPYIQQFHGKIVVIKYGGAAIDDINADDEILRDIVFMAAVGMRPIVVHGGGKRISRRLEAEGIESRFVHGLRVTDRAAIDVVEDVLAREINGHLVDVLRGYGGRATGLSGVSGKMIRVVKRRGEDDDGTPIDWGYVGDVARINPRPLFDELMDGSIPVIAPLGVDGDGVRFNVNADTIASEVASSLTAEKLVYITDVPGILRDKDDPSSLISSTRVTDIPALKRDGIVSGGMIPKVDACVHALHNHVHKTHIVSGRVPHSLLIEIFTDKGAGTEIIPATPGEPDGD